MTEENVTSDNITDQQIDDHLQLAQLVNTLSAEFDQICIQRHNDGAVKYGAFSFMGKDMLEEAIAEVADLANYARYAYIKIRMMQLTLQQHMEEFEAWRQSVITNKEADAPVRNTRPLIPSMDLPHDRPEHGFRPHGG